MPSLNLKGEISEIQDEEKIEWKIPDFLSLSTSEHSYYDSPSFSFVPLYFYLRIYPGGNGKGKNAYISLFLHKDSGPLHDVTFTLGIKKTDGTLFEQLSVTSALEEGNFGYWAFIKRSEFLQKKSELLNISESGTLTIICKVKNNTLQTKTADHPKEFKDLDELSSNFKALFANKESCDTVIRVENKEFTAHKTILMARSSVFAAMFQHDMSEKKTGVIDIPDCDSDSFEEFLDYIYSGKIGDISFHSAFHLYSTANKYDVLKLKSFCVDCIIHYLSVENLCEVVVLADKFDDMRLLAAAQDFFNENADKIVVTTDWENLLKNNYRLANKLIIKIVSKIKNGS